MIEVWKEIPGKEGRYAVSDCGRVKSLARTDSKGQPWPERILKPYLTGKAGGQYQTVHIDKLNEKVHRLVAIAFLPRQMPQVNHIDGNKINNHVSNLEWCTASENARHAFDVLGRKSSGGHKGKFGSKHHASKRVFAYPPGSQEPLEFGSGAEAARHIGCSSGSVPRTCNGKQNTSKGWRVHYV